jgi:steroid 5-alpha reductase family enzyme
MTDFYTFLDIQVKHLIILLLISLILWIVSLVKKDSSIIDPFWSILFISVAISTAYQQSFDLSNRAWVILVLVCIWGFRLFIHLFIRNWNKEEDYRYRSFRKQWGKNYWWGSYLQVFFLQAILAWVISSTLTFGMLSNLPLNILDGVALLVWLTGFYFEAVGDFQLRQFKSDDRNKGKLLTTGLWKYTRHPNYFGDAACWWGYALFALAAGQFTAVIGSLIMTYLLLNVSGVKLLEKSLGKNKPGYESYVRRTSAFLPLPPKKER